MSEYRSKLDGPDLTHGIDRSALSPGAMLSGHAHGEPVLLIEHDDSVFAVGASCPHYGAPLRDGLVVDETVRCPWHHACFSLRTGEVLRPPALDPLSCWRVEEADGKVYIREKLTDAARPPTAPAPGPPDSVVIVGGGPAGFAAAQTLRAEGFDGRVTILSADTSLPCDRPNLSKGFLSGAAPDETNLLKSPAFYQEQKIDVQLDARVTSIDTASQLLQLADGSWHSYGALLLATGAEPVRLKVPGSALPHVHYLRTLADSRALVQKAQTAKRAVVIGASFIGLEVAASLRARDIDVDIVGREAIPMAKILGREVGEFIRAMHEDHGVTFHLGTTMSAIDERSVTLDNGEKLDADLVVVGIGVRPVTALAEQAGLATDCGVLVDEFLETSVPNVFAAGDIARWPDRLTGERIRVEHFVVAERQGQTAARNILGRRQEFDAVPFFWTEQYDLGIAYVGHAGDWDEAKIDGQLNARDCSITYRRDGRKLAVAVIHRDLEGLRAELAFEKALAIGDDEPTPCK